MKSLLGKLFRRTPRADRTWTETVYVEEPSTPVTLYINCMLIQMSRADAQTKIFNRNEKLSTLTVGSRTIEPPPLDAFVEKLKEMCNIEPGPHSTPLDGVIPCTIQGGSFDVKCHFNDTDEACCWIRVEKSDEIRDFPTPEQLQKDRPGPDGYRVIRPGSPEYRFFTNKKRRLSWRERIKRSARRASICLCIVLGAEIIAFLIAGKIREPDLETVSNILFINALIFLLFLFMFAHER
jgi:hypothetical protein